MTNFEIPIVVNSPVVSSEMHRPSAKTTQDQLPSNNLVSSFPALSPKPFVPSYRPSNLPTYSSVLKSASKGSPYPLASALKPHEVTNQYSKDSNRDTNLVSEPKQCNYRHLPVAIYLVGISFMTIKEVKAILAAAPIAIQLRHVKNMSWIEQRILEILVDRNHVESMKNRIRNYSDYRIRTSFDPLAPDSFHWDKTVSPESQEKILKRNFIARLAASVAATCLTTTRQHIMDWVKNRGLGAKLEAELLKQGIRLSAENQPRQDSMPTSEDHHSKEQEFQTNRGWHDFKERVGAERYIKRKRSVSSIESIEG
jgi:hypothetical protein